MRSNAESTRRTGASLTGSPPQRLVLATTVAEVESLRQVWEDLHPRDNDADLDYFLAVVAGHPDVEGPCAILVERRERRPLLVVARIERRRFPARLGYLTMFTARLRSIVVSFDGFLGVEDDDDVRACLDALDECLRRRIADAAIVQKAEIGSATERLASVHAALARRVRGLETVRRWQADIPDSMDEFMLRRSKEARRRVRVEARKLGERYESVQLRRLGELPTEVLFSDIETVSKTTYQHALGVGGASTPLARSLAQTSIEHGWLRYWLLYLDGRPVSFWWGNRYDGVFVIETPSFDPAYGSDGVGMYVMHRMVEDLCADPDVVLLDFGHGDAEYKRRYASRAVEQRDVVFVAGRPGPIATGWLLSAMLSTNRLLYRLLRGTSFAQGLRRRWRGALERRPPSAQG